MMKKTNKPSSTLKPERPITATRNNTSHLPEPTENLEEYMYEIHITQRTTLQSSEDMREERQVY